MTPPTSLAQQAEALAKELKKHVRAKCGCLTTEGCGLTQDAILVAALQRLQSETREEDAPVVKAAEMWLKWRDEKQRIVKAGDYATREWNDAEEAFGEAVTALVAAIRARKEPAK